MINNIVGRLLAGVVAGIAGGLLIAAAVVGFADVVGVGGALAIVGGILLLIAAIIVAVLQQDRRRPTATQDSEFKIGEIAAGFLLGVWDGLTKPRKRD